MVFQRRGIYYVNSLINKQYPDDLNHTQNVHDAFIVIQSAEEKATQYMGLDNLIIEFKRRKYPFKIYDCYNSDDFKEILRKKTAKYVWIFGHGWRGGVTFKLKKSLIEKIMLKKKQEKFEYNHLMQEIDTYPRKSFIGQFHCNHLEDNYDNTPLVSILLDEDSSNNYFITDSTLTDCSIWFATREVLKEIKRQN